LAGAIKSQFDLEPELIEGKGGVFDVTVDGKLIYSKHETGCFPEHGEILEKLTSQPQ